MYKVIRKDLILNRTVLLLNVVVVGVALTLLTTMDRAFPAKVYAGFASFMVAFFPLLVVIREDKFNAMAFGCSLPVRRSTVVKARYVMALAFGVVGLALAFLLVELNPASDLRASDMFRRAPILVGLAGVALTQALLLPFTLRYGIRGIFIFMITAQVMGVLLLTLTRATGSGMDRRILTAVGKGLDDLHGWLGPWGFSLALVSVLALLLLGSCRWACVIFRRREF